MTMQPHHTVTDRRRGAARALATLAALAGVTVLVAGCGGGDEGRDGGGSNPGVANVKTTSTSTTRSSTASGDGGGGAPSTSSASTGGTSSFSLAGGNPQQELKFSQCMRAHGVPSFPDPNGQGVIQGSGLNPSSPQFQAASRRCARYVGAGSHAPTPAQQAQAEAQALKFSQCMRSHGVPNFPDPQFNTSGGGISIKISAKGGPGGGGLDPNSPIFQKAQTACSSLLPGRPGRAGGAVVAKP